MVPWFNAVSGTALTNWQTGSSQQIGFGRGGLHSRARYVLSYAYMHHSPRHDWIRSNQQCRFSLVHNFHNVAPQWLLLRRCSRVGLVWFMYRNIVRSTTNHHEYRVNESTTGTPCPAVHSALQSLPGVLLLFTLMLSALAPVTAVEPELKPWPLHSRSMQLRHMEM
jgi:hypothetical protein